MKVAASEEVEAAVSSLDPESRFTVGQIWAERARSELGAGSGFAQVVVALYQVGADPKVLSLATNAAHEEIEHAKSCHRLAELYLGRAVDMPTPKKVGVPPHHGATDELRATLHVMGLCCFNETIAVEFVARQLDASTAPSVLNASRTHLRDEIGHARVGWAHLGSDRLDRADRKRISAWMARLTKANGELWMERLQMLPKRGVDGHGYPPRTHFAEGVRKALLEVVIPGLDAAGLDASGAAREARAL